MQFSTNISRPGRVNIFKNTPYRPCQTVTYEVNYSDRNLIFRNCFILRLKLTVDGPTLSAVKNDDTTACHVGPCAFSNKCIIKLSLKIQMHSKRATTLPCEIFGTLWHSVVFLRHSVILVNDFIIRLLTYLVRIILSSQFRFFCVVHYCFRISMHSATEALWSTSAHLTITPPSQPLSKQWTTKRHVFP